MYIKIEHTYWLGAITNVLVKCLVYYLQIKLFVFRIVINQIMHSPIILFAFMIFVSNPIYLCPAPVPLFFVSACQSRVLLQAGFERR